MQDNAITIYIIKQNNEYYIFLSLNDDGLCWSVFSRDHQLCRICSTVVVLSGGLQQLYMEFITDYVTITKPEHIELLKIKAKYDALIKRSILFLSNNNIYCRLCTKCTIKK